MVSRVLAGVAAAAVLLAGCTAPESPEQPPGPQSSTSGSSTSPSAPPPSASERLGLETGWGPSRRELDRAVRDVRRLSLPQLAGQVIVARWQGTGAPTRMVRELHLGGVVAFSANVVSADQLRRATRTLRRAVRRPWPLLVTVDQEGGRVQRVRGQATSYPTFMAAGAAHQPRLTGRAYAASGRELRGLGMNVVLAPDTDVTTGPSDPVIGARSAGSDPQAVGRQGVAAAEGFLRSGVVPVVKHFPGHGSLSVDSHLGLPRQTRTRAELGSTDLVPFREAVRAGLPAVMIGHIAVRSWDPGVPATVSRPVITDLLRDRLGFGGVVMSDSLEMAALRGPRQPAVGFLRAGGDVVLMPPDPALTRDTIVRAVRQGRLTRDRLVQAAARTVALLRHHADRGRSAPPGSARGVVGELAAEAVTVVAGRCRGALVEGTVTPLGPPGAVARFRTAARAAGMRLGEVHSVKPPRPERTGNKKRDRRRLKQWRRTEPRRVVPGTPVHLVQPGAAAPGDGVVVALDTPYVLGRSSAPVRVATYGDAPASMRALVAVLQGRARAPGRLPVPVAGVERRGC